MNRSRQGSRRPIRFSPTAEGLEGRQLLSGLAARVNRQLAEQLTHPVGYPAVRPNLPVLPFGTPGKTATYVDPTSQIANGDNVIIGFRTFIGPYSALDATKGHIKIGSASSIQDNASIVANPGRRGSSNIFIGDLVVVGYGATVLGPSTIGAYSEAAQITYIGPEALIDGATVQAGAIVSAMARVGPGVTVPSGYVVLPGVNLTSQAEAVDPALGKVRLATASDYSNASALESNDITLAYGYIQLYQGNSATGANPGVEPNVSGVFNGNLSAVLGASSDPGPTYVSFETARGVPKFRAPHRPEFPGTINDFHARLTGNTIFRSRAKTVAAALGRGNSFRADQGQPITVGSIGQTGSGVTINSPLGGSVTIGQNFKAGSGVVLLGGKNVNVAIGDNVSIGAGAVVDRTSLGAGTVVGANSYLEGSSFPAGTVIAPGSIYINNQYVGNVQW
jgi:carbonic anhydrase/acetyltransferase-like protein (isoleucine patch superfamily)